MWDLQPVGIFFEIFHSSYLSGPFFFFSSFVFFPWMKINFLLLNTFKIFRAVLHFMRVFRLIVFCLLNFLDSKQYPKKKKKTYSKIVRMELV